MADLDSEAIDFGATLRETRKDLAGFGGRHVLAMPQTWNKYVSARSNPLSYRDPDGHVVETALDIAKDGRTQRDEHWRSEWDKGRWDGMMRR